MSYFLKFSKDQHKFSASHMTVLSDKSKEPLHGHNYYVETQIKTAQLDPKLNWVCDLNLIKSSLKPILDSLDEKTLFPLNSERIKVTETDKNYNIVYSPTAGMKKHYSLPTDEVNLLACVNITCEALAKHIHDELIATLKQSSTLFKLNPFELSIFVQETRGQGAGYESKQNL